MGSIGLIICLLVLLVGSLAPASPATAQDSQPDGPIYVVQAGDSLWDIAYRFGVTLEALQTQNGITDPNQLVAGTRLVIPGLSGIQGELATASVTYGESLLSMSRRYGVSQQVLARLNHLTSPAELYAGRNLVILAKQGDGNKYRRAALAPGQSLMELAVLQGANPWNYVISNSLPGTWSALPGDTLLLPGGEVDGPGAFPGEVSSVEITPLPLLQGKTTVIQVYAQPGLSIGGSLMERPLNFFWNGDGRYIALQGVHAMSEPGLYKLSIWGRQSDGAAIAYSQNIRVDRVDYPFDRPLTVNPATIDPAVTRPEDAQWSALTAPVTPDRLWDGKFKLPSPLPTNYCVETNECWSSRFGNRRSYNGSPYDYFHTGLDVVGGVGTEIYAPAAGVVVFVGPLTVRGNATVIDHGWGVYTAYMHQSQIDVKIGERVEKGQLIGLVGGTGRVEGPHLHWEVWVGGVQVEPLDWLTNSYP